MKTFKEWLSDNLRYIMLGAAVIFVIVILFLAFQLLRPYYGEGETNKPTEAQTVQKKTEKTEQTKKEETQKAADTSKKGETQKASDTPETKESETNTSEKSTDTTAQTKASEAQAPPTEAAVIETEMPQTQWQEPETEWTEQVQETQWQDLGTITMNQTAYIRQEPSYEGAILGQLAEGQNVTFLEDVGGWYKVDADGMIGYVGARFFN